MASTNARAQLSTVIYLEQWIPLILQGSLVLPKSKITPWFTHPQAIVYNFLLSDEYSWRYIKKMSWLFQVGG